jgi:hypothetical protein
MLRRVVLVRTDVSEELSAYFIKVTICELGTTLAVTSKRRTLRRNTRATRRNIPEDTILHSHRRENLKSYIYCVVRTMYYVVFLRSVRRLLIKVKLFLLHQFLSHR